MLLNKYYKDFSRRVFVSEEAFIIIIDSYVEVQVVKVHRRWVIRSSF